MDEEKISYAGKRVKYFAKVKIDNEKSEIVSIYECFLQN